MARSPELWITAERKGGERFLTLSSGRKRLKLPLTLKVQQELRNWRFQLPKRLGKFHDAVCRDGTSPEKLLERGRKAVYELRDIGRDLQIILAQNHATLCKLRKFLSEEIRTLSPLRGEPNLIQLEMSIEDNDLLPLSIEYLLNESSLPKAINGQPELQEALSCYAGFNAVVAHSIYRKDDEYLMDHWLKGQPPAGALPTKIIRHHNLHADLKGSSEVHWLARQRSRCFCEPLWPDNKCTSGEASSLLAECLSDPHQEFDRERARRLFSDQIQHISCHYHLGGESPILTLRDPWVLNLEIEALDEIKIEIDDLRRNIASPRDNKTDQQPGPFLFVNACASGGVSRESISSLIDTLLFFTKARAVLVTETEVHIPYAAAFARRVYSHLFDNKSLGEAVLRARWDLVRSDSNPFGILYTLYGDPHLRIVRD